MASVHNPKHVCRWQNSSNCSPSGVYAWYAIVNGSWPGLHSQYEMRRFHGGFLSIPIRSPKERPRIIWLCEHHGKIWESVKWGLDKGYEYPRWNGRESLYSGQSMRLVDIPFFDTPYWTYESFHKMKETGHRPRLYYFVERFNERNGGESDDGLPGPGF